MAGMAEQPEHGSTPGCHPNNTAACVPPQKHAGDAKAHAALATADCGWFQSCCEA